MRKLRFSEKIHNARVEVDRIAGQLNYMTERAYDITKKFNAALIAHQEQEIKKERGKALRQGVAMITGMVVGAAGAMFTPGVGIGSLGAGVDAGQALGSAFADIIASKDDYPTNCNKCDTWRAQLMEAVGYTRDPAADNSSVTFTDAAIEGEAGFVSDTGYLYQDKLTAYRGALQKLKAAQDEEGEYDVKAKDIGSKGGPP